MTSTHWYVVAWDYGSDDPLELCHIVQAKDCEEAIEKAFAEYEADGFDEDYDDEPEKVDREDVRIRHILRCDTKPVYV